MNRTCWIALGAALTLAACVEDNAAATDGGGAGGAVATDAGGAGGAGGMAGAGGVGGSDCMAGLVAEPSEVRFPRDGTTGPREQILTVRNDGDCTATFGGAQLEGSSAFELRLDGRDPRRMPEVLADPDSDGEPGLAPGRSFTLKVLFNNPDNAAHQGEVVFPGGADSVQVPLWGDADGACLQVDPPALTFDPVAVGDGTLLPLTLRACGDQPVQIEAIRFDGAPGYQLVEDPPAQLAGDGSPTVLQVAFVPAMEGALSGRLIVLSDDPLLPQATVQLLGRANARRCPTPVIAPVPEQVPLGSVVTLDGSPSTTSAGDVVRYEWIVVERPAGSVATPVEAYFNADQPADGGAPDNLGTPQAQLLADVPGRYSVQLRITDSADQSSEGCSEATVTFLATAAAAGRLQVQLVWDTPQAGPGTDLDLQLIHPLAGEPPAEALVCDADNAAPDWGAEGPEHDPVLDVDDVDGDGPENIVIDTPQPTAALGAPYRLRVRYVADAGGARPVVATVRVFAAGALLDERSSAIEAPGDLWEVGTLPWPAERIVPPAP